LYGAFLVKKFKQGGASFPSSVSLFDLKARFFVPTCASRTSARARAGKVGRRTNPCGMFRSCQATPRRLSSTIAPLGRSG
jgi:hypothetical protein